MFSNLRSTPVGLKIREKFYPAFSRDEEVRIHIDQALERFNRCPDKKSRARIRREAGVCKKYWRCHPHQYFIQDLYRRDRELSDDELCSYIPPFFWYKLFLPYHTPRTYAFIGENKIVIEQFFRSLAIPRPVTLGIVLGGFLYSGGMETLQFDELQKTSAEKIFVKPVDGWGGRGIHIFHKGSNGGYFSTDGTGFRDFITGLTSEKRDAIIQEGIPQDPGIAGIHPESVNTCRIITENTDGAVRAVCAVWRMGRGPSEIDNVSSGGMCTHVDIVTGKTGAFAVSTTRETFLEHPDSHIPFETCSVPQWQAIRNFAIQSAGKLPFLTYIGWDIALTPDGPVALEINRLPSVDIMELTSSGLRDAFRINDPGFYWAHPRKA